eukprot:c27955_g1_i1 orf=123-1574(+)
MPASCSPSALPSGHDWEDPFTDCEGNADLSLEILAKARNRCAQKSPIQSRVVASSLRDGAIGNGVSEAGFVERPSKGIASKEELTVGGSGCLGMGSGNAGKVVAERANNDVPVRGQDAGKKKKDKKRKKGGNTEADDAGGKEMFKVVEDDAGDNLVMRKLLRGPRYFNEPEGQTCFRCGNVGHMAADCIDEPRKKACYTCGDLGHEGRDCPQGSCFICKGIGHFARSCPNKNEQAKKDSGSNRICLFCGDSGHDHSVCYRGYKPDDLKMIQCYVCKSYGHLCCVDIVDSSPRQISCYNCGETGHSGVGCAKSRTTINDDDKQPAKSCYKCGQEGHFARGCSKSDVQQRFHDPQTPDVKKLRGFPGFKSVPRDIGARPKWVDATLEERHARTPGYPQQRNRWNKETQKVKWDAFAHNNVGSNLYMERLRHEWSEEHAGWSLERNTHSIYKQGMVNTTPTGVDTDFKRNNHYQRSDPRKKRFHSR